MTKRLPMQRRRAIAMCCAGCLLLPLRTGAALAAPTAPFDQQALAKLARQRPRDCARDEQPEPAAPGWRAAGARCAWKGLLVMRQWMALPDAAGDACVGAAARWWAWEQQRVARPGGAPATAWHTAWTTQSLAGRSGQQYRLAFVERGPGAAWTATELTWTPSPREATRAWQAARWKEIGALGTGRSSAAPPDIGERNLRGRAGELSEQGLTWQAGASCLRLVAAPPAEPSFPLAYAREDARLEQRAAMQVQLARRYPLATWLTSFSLLDLAQPAGTGGASYDAIWVQGTTVTGQLWLPTKERAVTRRFRILANLPASYDTPAGMAAAAAARTAVERELRALAQLATSAP